jgi:hypothetical protein
MARPKVSIVFESGARIGGKAKLLEGVRDTGSISAAPREMGMSYKRAWLLLDSMNQAFSEFVVTAAPGGAGGGCICLGISYLPVGNREARADCQGGELIDRVAAGAPVGQLLFIEALGHTRVPFSAYRPDHRARVELAAIDAHRAAEAAADIERGLDADIAGEARRDRLEIGDFPGRDAAGHSVPPRWVRHGVQDAHSYGTKRSCRHVYCVGKLG